jgi:uncharacterized OB-fold protein
MKCRLCGSDSATVKEDVETVLGMQVKLLYTECDNCGAEFVPTDQIRENDRRIKESKNEK